MLDWCHSLTQIHPTDSVAYSQFGMRLTWRWLTGGKFLILGKLFKFLNWIFVIFLNLLTNAEVKKMKLNTFIVGRMEWALVWVYSILRWHSYVVRHFRRIKCDVGIIDQHQINPGTLTCWVKTKITLEIIESNPESLGLFHLSRNQT